MSASEGGGETRANEQLSELSAATQVTARVRQNLIDNPPFDPAA
jgi:hypothetical protein